MFAAHVNRSNNVPSNKIDVPSKPNLLLKVYLGGFKTNLTKSNQTLPYPNLISMPVFLPQAPLRLGKKFKGASYFKGTGTSDLVIGTFFNERIYFDICFNR